VSGLEVRLRKTFTGRKRSKFAVDVEFAVPAGVTVIFGPSGSGKTTILQCIAGLVNATSGHISIDGEPLFDSAKKLNMPAQLRHVGYVFQDLALFPHMTAAQNVAFGIRVNGNIRKQLVFDALEKFRIAHLSTHRPNEISGGERQRVALARTLVTHPRLLLLDEPFSALDDALKQEIIADLKKWLTRNNIPVVFVTHDRSEARALGERVLLLHEGKIVGEDSAGNL